MAGQHTAGAGGEVVDGIPSGQDLAVAGEGEGGRHPGREGEAAGRCGGEIDDDGLGAAGCDARHGQGLAVISQVWGCHGPADDQLDGRSGLRLGAGC